MAYRPEFKEAIRLIAEAIGKVAAQDHAAPILVGGAAVELFTGSAVVSGDFDFVTPERDAFFQALQEVGFERPSAPGWLTWGLIHPDLDIGVQVVSGQLMDGQTDPSKIQLVEVEGNGLRVIPVEDLIADRLA